MSEHVNSQDMTIECNTKQHIEVENTAILECLDVVKNEYDIERNKKQSFENRAGLIITILAAICIFLFEKIQMSDILSLIQAPLTFLIFLKTTAGILVYAGFIFTILMVFRTISVKRHDNFEVSGINEQFMKKDRLIALCAIIYTYQEIVIQHREENEKRASSFRKALLGIIFTIFCTIVYISI